VQRIVDVDVPTATAEDTIIAKLDWAKEGGSDRQIADVASIVRLRGEALDRGYIEKWILADQCAQTVPDSGLHGGSGF
jgi:hypothetical protein